MERDDRSGVTALPSVASFFLETRVAPGDVIDLDDAAAHHARVKRLAVRDVVRLTDGAGHVAFGRLAALDRRGATVDIDAVHSVPQPSAIHVRVPVGDRDRMLWLAEKATELGVSSWQGVRFKRSASVLPRGEGSAFATKVRARMIGALEQSGGAWLPRVDADVALDALGFDASMHPLLLDVGGEPILELLGRAGGSEPVLLFGPEGGLEASERASLIERGWRPVRLAETTLRFETAGIAGIAVLRAAGVASSI